MCYNAATLDTDVCTTLLAQIKEDLLSGDLYAGEEATCAASPVQEFARSAYMSIRKSIRNDAHTAQQHTRYITDSEHKAVLQQTLEDRHLVPPSLDNMKRRAKELPLYEDLAALKSRLQAVQDTCGGDAETKAKLIQHLDEGLSTLQKSDNNEAAGQVLAMAADLWELCCSTGELTRWEQVDEICEDLQRVEEDILQHCTERKAHLQDKAKVAAHETALGEITGELNEDIDHQLQQMKDAVEHKGEADKAVAERKQEHKYPPYLQTVNSLRDVQQEIERCEGQWADELADYHTHHDAQLEEITAVKLCQREQLEREKGETENRIQVTEWIISTAALVLGELHENANVLDHQLGELTLSLEADVNFRGVARRRAEMVEKELAERFEDSSREQAMLERQLVVHQEVCSRMGQLLEERQLYLDHGTRALTVAQHGALVASYTHHHGMLHTSSLKLQKSLSQKEHLEQQYEEAQEDEDTEEMEKLDTQLQRLDDSIGAMETLVQLMEQSMHAADQHIKSVMRQGMVVQGEGPNEHTAIQGEGQLHFHTIGQPVVTFECLGVEIRHPKLELDTAKLTDSRRREKKKLSMLAKQTKEAEERAAQQEKDLQAMQLSLEVSAILETEKEISADTCLV